MSQEGLPREIFINDKPEVNGISLLVTTVKPFFVILMIITIIIIIIIIIIFFFLIIIKENFISRYKTTINILHYYHKSYIKNV